MTLNPDAPVSMKYGPMLIGISYDGGNINNTSSACPCAVTVGNTNYGGLDAAATIMYMNHLEVFGANRDTEKFRLARHHLYQEIIVSVVSVIERVQQNGVVCSLPTGPHNEEETWTLLPVLAAAQFDTKERYKFFANRSERSCAICSGPRKGRSAFRRGTPHANRWTEIQVIAWHLTWCMYLVYVPDKCTWCMYLVNLPGVITQPMHKLPDACT